MHNSRSHLTYALGTLVIGGALILVAPVGAENSSTIDQSTQPHLKSWSNVIPNANRRFIVLADFSNQAVLDRETGLVWEQSPDTTTRDWATARHYCVNKNVGGRRGWRLPSVPELASLIDPSLPAPHVPVSVFTGAQTGFSDYFSASESASATPDFPIGAGAWGVEFGNGDVDVYSKTSTLFTWCVRGPMNADSY